MFDNKDETKKRQALSVADFCRDYGISPTTFYAQVKLGKLAILKMGRRTLIAQAEAERWLNSL
jgi:hypothetical protein